MSGSSSSAVRVDNVDGAVDSGVLDDCVSECTDSPVVAIRGKKH